MLEYLSYEVTACDCGEEAVALYRAAFESGKPFYAALMDMTIPGGMGGKEAAQQIIAIDPAARLILSSGYSNDPIMANHREYGFCCSIAKPYKLAEIAKAMNTVLVQSDTNA
jgi:CheY-like chemotaxis protein